MMQLPPQVGERLGIGRVGPEEQRDPLAGLRRSGVGDEVGDERDGSRRAGAYRTRRVVDDGLLTEQGHGKHDRRPFRAHTLDQCGVAFARYNGRTTANQSPIRSRTSLTTVRAVDSGVKASAAAVSSATDGRVELEVGGGNVELELLDTGRPGDGDDARAG